MGKRPPPAPKSKAPGPTAKPKLPSLILIALTSARQAILRATEAEFDAGTATMLQVLTAQQNFADAQSQYVRAKAGAVIAAYNLLSAMGQMTTERLNLPVQHFNSLDQL